jgi:hypothetical protein
VLVPPPTRNAASGWGRVWLVPPDLDTPSPEGPAHSPPQLCPSVVTNRAVRLYADRRLQAHHSPKGRLPLSLTSGGGTALCGSRRGGRRPSNGSGGGNGVATWGTTAPGRPPLGPSTIVGAGADAVVLGLPQRPRSVSSSRQGSVMHKPRGRSRRWIGRDTDVLIV